MEQTKGEWSFWLDDDSTRVTAYISTMKDGKLANDNILRTPETTYCSKDVDEVAANARLITAAPDLIEACKYVVQYHRENDSGEGELFGLDFVTTCIAAIQKAEGA